MLPASADEASPSVPRKEPGMSRLRRTWLAGWLAGSMAVTALPALAGEVVQARCCSWFPNWFFGGYYPAPAYYAGPLSGATYEYYYGSYWGRPHSRHRRVILK
jgi:hypothetical protein